MSVAVRCAAFAWFVAVAAGPYPDGALEYLAEAERATNAHLENVRFLKEVMLVDYMWSPVLNEKVRVKWPAKIIDHYVDTGPLEESDLEVLPLEEISELLITNTFAGTKVRRAMAAFRTAMACSVLRHVSFQSIIVHHLLTNPDTQVTTDEKEQHVEWLEHMARLSIDKLAAIDQALEPVTRLHSRAAGILSSLSKKQAAALDTEGLRDVGVEMYAEMEKMCVVPSNEEAGQYGELIDSLNRSQTVEELVAHRTRFTDTMRGASAVENIQIMKIFSGKITIDKKIDPNGFGALTVSVLKRASATNYILMTFFFLNFPIQTMAESQWATLTNIRKPETQEEQPIPLSVIQSEK